VPHPLLEDLVRETYGVLVYQEQVMESARIIAGYTLGGADILRRAMGKKIKSVMDEQKQVFIEGARKTNDIDAKTATAIFALLEKFAQYGFNKSHSAAYAMLSYRTAYLKANYPVEFMSAVLTSEQGNADKISHLLGECNAMNVPVLNPDINDSGATFTPIITKENSSIRFGMAAIKGVGEGAAKLIIDEREANGPYEDFTDFIVRQADKAVNRRVIEALIKTGAFDSLGQDRAALLDSLDSELAEAESKRRDRESGQGSLFDMMDLGDPKSENRTNNNGSQRKPVPEMSITEKLRHERELLGVYISGHPMDAFAGLDTAIDTFRSPDELTQFDDRDTFRICGIINNLQIKYTRRDSRQMAVFNLATVAHSYELIMFPEPYEKNGSRLEEGKLALIHGLINRRNGETGLVAHEIFDLEQSIPRVIQGVTFILNPNHSRTIDFINTFREMIDSEHGSTRSGLSFLINDQVVEADIAQSLTFKITNKNYKKLRHHPALVGVRIKSVPVQPIDDRRPWER
jgi:DNA polymerase-3 subunit alpha